MMIKFSCVPIIRPQRTSDFQFLCGSATREDQGSPEPPAVLSGWEWETDVHGTMPFVVTVDTMWQLSQTKLFVDGKECKQ